MAPFDVRDVFNELRQAFEALPAETQTGQPFEGAGRRPARWRGGVSARVAKWCTGDRASDTGAGYRVEARKDLAGPGNGGLLIADDFVDDIAVHAAKVT